MRPKAGVNWDVFFFLAPKTILFVAFVLIPFVYTFVLMFQMGTLLSGFHFVGFANLINIFHDQLFFTTLKNTLIYMCLVVPLIMTVPLAVGLFFTSSIKGIKIYRALIYIPSLLSIVAASLVWRVMVYPKVGLLDKIFNQILKLDIEWLSNGTTALILIAFISLWHSIGFYSILFMAGLNDIPSSLYDAAKIDGATSIKSFWYITLPLLKPIMQLILVLITIYSIQVFDVIYVLTQGGPGTSTYTVMWYIYKNVFSQGSIGYAAAMGVVMLLLTLLLSVFIMKGTRSEAHDG